MPKYEMCFHLKNRVERHKILVRDDETLESALPEILRQFFQQHGDEDGHRGEILRHV